MATNNPHHPNGINHHTGGINFMNALGIQTITPPPNNNGSNINGGPLSDSDDGSEAGDGADLEIEERASKITIKINTPLIVKGDNNLIALDPSLQASRIASSLVQALKQLSASSHGVPMIDENGAPRPIAVEIQAEVTVTGARNVVGEKPVLASMASVNASAAATKTKAQAGNDDKESKSKEVRKRERADSDVGEADAKRIKNE